MILVLLIVFALGLATVAALLLPVLTVAALVLTALASIARVMLMDLLGLCLRGLWLVPVAYGAHLIGDNVTGAIWITLHLGLAFTVYAITQIVAERLHKPPPFLWEDWEETNAS